MQTKSRIGSGSEPDVTSAIVRPSVAGKARGLRVLTTSTPEKYKRKALGDYGSLTGNDVFGQAKKDAEAFADMVESGGTPQRSLKLWRMPAGRASGKSQARSAKAYFVGTSTAIQSPR